MKTANTVCRPPAGMRVLIIGFVACFFVHRSGALSADPILPPYTYVGTQTTSNFSAPAEYCVSARELSYEANKWVLRYNLEIPAIHHFRNGDVFVSFTHPSMPGATWFSSGETPSAAGFKPASWRSYSEHGVTAAYSGVLNPVIPVNVVSKPVDLSSLEGGKITIGYGFRENANSTVADAYQEMKTHLYSDGVVRERLIGAIFTSSADQIRGSFKLLCFTVTSVKTIEGCVPGECIFGEIETFPQSVQ